MDALKYKLVHKVECRGSKSDFIADTITLLKYYEHERIAPLKRKIKSQKNELRNMHKAYMRLNELHATGLSLRVEESSSRWKSLRAKEEEFFTLLRMVLESPADAVKYANARYDIPKKTKLWDLWRKS